MKRIYFHRIIHAAETFFSASSFSRLFYRHDIPRSSNVIVRSYDAESRRKFEVTGKGGKGMCNFSQTFFIWSLSFIFSFLWYLLDKSSHTHVGMGIIGHYGIHVQYFTFPRDVCVFLAGTFNHVKQKHWTKNTHVLDFRSVLSPLVSAELIERYSFRGIVPSTGLHWILFLSPGITRERNILRGI